MARYDDCKANKVCDHDKYGFENCDNFISKTDIARKIFNEIDVSMKEYVNGDIDGNTLFIRIHILKTKYTEGD